MLATAPEPLMDLKEEDVVVEEVDGRDVELSSAVKEPYKVLKPSMNNVHMWYNALFQTLLEAVEQSSGDMSEGVPAVLCDSKYNTRQIAYLSNLES